ncbi:hypothetical protein ACWEVD_18780 [Nocardia thailandica]
MKFRSGMLAVAAAAGAVVGPLVVNPATAAAMPTDCKEWKSSGFGAEGRGMARCTSGNGEYRVTIVCVVNDTNERVHVSPPAWRKPTAISQASCPALTFGPIAVGIERRN